MARVAREPIVIDFWDVGQGDATVIRPTPDNAFIIDVGPRNSPLIDWILRNPRINIEGLVLTHNDADHAGALAALIDGAAVRIQCVYFLQDRDKKKRPFAKLFSRLDDAYKSGELTKILRLESPQVIWCDSTGAVELTVRYPSVMQNIPATSPNVTSAVVVLTARNIVKVIWASDAPLELVAKHCSGARPDYMVGPHHGAPVDRSKSAAEEWLRDIGAETILVSVGSNNTYPHPQKSFIRKSRHAGSRIVCTELTKLCDKNRRTDVIKSHARYAVPPPNTGIACRGTVRVMLSRNDDIIGDDLDNAHQEEIKKLQRPQCLLLAPRKNGASPHV